MLRFTVFLALFLAAPLWAVNERLIHLQTSLPVGPDHIADITINDRDGLVVFDGKVVGPIVDISFPFVASDLTGDGSVNFDDFFKFADQFNKAGANQADLNQSGKVDFTDFFIFADQFGLRIDEGVAKLVTADDQWFADNLERNAARFGANLAAPQVIAEIQRLRQKLGAGYTNPSLTGSNISQANVRVYNILGQSVCESDFSTFGSGVYFAVLMDENNRMAFGKTGVVRFTVIDHRAELNGLDVSNMSELTGRVAEIVKQRLYRGVVAQPMVAAKTAAIGFSFTINIKSESNSFAPVTFQVPAPPPGEAPVISGTIEELTGGAVVIHAAPQAIAGLPVVALVPGDTSRVSLSSLFIVQGGIRSARILAVPDSLTASLPGTTLLVSGLTSGRIDQIQVEVMDSLGLIGENTISVRSPVITRALSVSPVDTTIVAGTEISVPARGSLALFYDGQLSKTSLVELTLVSQDSVQVDSLVTMTLRFSYEDLEAIQTIAIRPAPPPPVVVSHHLVVTAPDSVGYAEQPFTVSAVFVTYEDDVETGRVSVTPNEGTEVSGLLLGSQTLVFHYSGSSATVTVAVVDRPPVIRIRLDRYQSALGSGRNMEFRIDVNDDIALSRDLARVVAHHGQDSVVTEVALMQIERSSGYTYGAVSIPAATSANPVTWTLVGYMTDSAGQVGTASLEFQQEGWVSPPPPPCDDTCHGCGTWTACGRYCGDCPPPPPPVAPTIQSATVNSVASGTITVAAGSTLTLSASYSGTPTPTAMWTLGSQSTSGASASLTAQSGTLTLTVSNSAGSVSRTWSIAALGAP